MALDGKVAVVTGAAMGIGKAVMEILLQNGAKVALLDVNESAAANTVQAFQKEYGRGKTLSIKCDVESEEQIKAALQKVVETFGGIDILCNNAGVFNETTWEKTVSINLMGVIRVTYQALEFMNKKKGGRGGVIVNTASMAGLGPVPSCPVYCATKHGVVAFTRAMAAASSALGYGVRFNTICPGFVKTELSSSISVSLGPYSQLADAIKQITDSFGTTQASELAKSFLETMTDETKSGEALMVTTKVKKYMTFPNVF